MTANELYLSSNLRIIEMRHADQPLMQRAGAAAAEWALELAADGTAPVLILAGPGNNGGDAFEVGRQLRARFFDVRLVFAGNRDKLPADAAAACQRFIDAGGSILADIPESDHWSLIVDGLFGIGLARAPDGQYAQRIVMANQLAERDHCPLLALDCPSGLNADTGTVFSPCIQASHSITFIAAKPGLFTGDGPDHCGEIRVARLDLDPAAECHPDARHLVVSDFANHLKPRRLNSHKGSFGSAGILGGSPSMVGAALLAARAALKLGAGRVYLGLLDSDGPSVDPVQPELMMRRADALLQTDLQAIACGPGLGTSAEARHLLEQALNTPVPLVLDADALNLVAEDRELEALLTRRASPGILTPHPAEAARLLDCQVADVQADRLKAAAELATRYRSHVALKGCGTVLATISGAGADSTVNRNFGAKTKIWLNTTGNPGMATAGMGDVLCGLIVALLAQNWPSDMALLAAVHLHGAAADWLVANGIGPIGLTAGEVIDPARQIFNEWIGSNASL